MSVLTKVWLGENLNGSSDNEIFLLKEEGLHINSFFVHFIRLSYTKVVSFYKTFKQFIPLCVQKYYFVGKNTGSESRFPVRTWYRH